MARAKVAKVSTKSVKTRVATPKVGDKRTAQIHGRPATVAKMAQDKQTKVIDELARLAIELHRDALKELERY